MLQISFCMRWPQTKYEYPHGLWQDNTFVQCAAVKLPHNESAGHIRCSRSKGVAAWRIILKATRLARLLGRLQLFVATVIWHAWVINIHLKRRKRRRCELCKTDPSKNDLVNNSMQQSIAWRIQSSRLLQKHDFLVYTTDRFAWNSRKLGTRSR